MQGGSGAQPVTIISPIRRFWKWWLLLSWLWADRSAWVKRPLIELSFIHFAHWAVVSRIPASGWPWRSQRLPHPYLLFQSNFDDDLDAYIDAFAFVVPGRIRGVWGGSYNFPGPLPADRFIQYISDHNTRELHYYCAYPDDSTSMIVSALELKERLARFQERTHQRGDRKFNKRLDKLLQRSELQRLPEGPVGAPTAQTTAFMLLAPVLRGHEQELENVLEALPRGRDSPFALLAGTHFARLTVLRALLDEHDEPLAPARAYLLFSADFDGPLAQWLLEASEALTHSLDGILVHCVGYRGERELGSAAVARTIAAYLRTYRVRPGFSIRSYRASVAHIRHALELQPALRRFAVGSRGRKSHDARKAFERWAQEHSL